MTDPDEPDWERMRQEEETYFAVKDKPPKGFAEIGEAALRKAGAAKSRRPQPRKVKELAR